MDQQSSPRPAFCAVGRHQVIDVTLRDGGFRSDFAWDDRTAQAVIEGAFASGADYCELGYVGGLPELHGLGAPKKYSALTAMDIHSLTAKSAEDRHSSRFCVMRHPTGEEPQPRPCELVEANVHMVRFVFHPSWAEKLRQEHEEAKSVGLQTAINIALASKYSQHQLGDLADKIAQLEPDVIYIADTCGALHPTQVVSLVDAMGATTDVGFHGHDYLTLAIANSLAAVQAGASWIDTSLLGLGRGAGNARTEIWGAFRACSERIKLDPHAQLRAIEELHHQVGNVAQADWISVICGAANLTPPEEDAIRSATDPELEALRVYEGVLEEHAGPSW